MFGITDKWFVSLFNRHGDIFEVVGNASFSTPPLMDLLNSSLWSFSVFVDISGVGGRIVKKIS